MFRVTSPGGNRGPIDDFWYRPISYDVSLGRVSPAQALRLSVVYACVKVLAETIAHLPLILYQRRDDGGKDRISDHPAAKLVSLRPNNWQTPFEFREMMQGHLGLRGNAYALKKFAGNGLITDLIPLNPDRVTPQRVVGTNSLRYVYQDLDGNSITYRQSEILHLRGMTADGLIGLNPIEVERIAVSFGLTTQDYGLRFYANDASAGNWIEYPGKFESREARRKFRENYQDMQTGKNRFKTPVLDDGLKLHEMQLKNTDAQFLETRKYQDVDICRIFRMQPHKVGILDQATFSNIEQQALEHVVDTLLPWGVRWEERLSLELLNADEQDEYFFEFLFDGLLRGDSTARANFYNKGITSGWLTRNEARIRDNMNPLPGLDEPLEPLNMQPAGSDPNAGQEPEPQEPPADSEPPSKPGKGAKPKAKRAPRGRAALLEKQTAGYLVRKEIANARGLYGREDRAVIRGGIERFYAIHGAFISKTLVIDPVAAQRYASDSKAALLKALEAEESGKRGAYAALLEEWSENRVTQLLEKVHDHE